MYNTRPTCYLSYPFLRNCSITLVWVIMSCTSERRPWTQCWNGVIPWPSLTSCVYETNFSHKL